LGLLLFGMTMAVGRLTASAMLHRLGTRRMLLAGGTLCTVSLLLAALPVSTEFTIFWLTALGFGVSTFWPTVLGAAGDRYPQAGASMYSLLSASGSLGCMAAPLAVGVVGDAMGLRVGMAFLAAAPLVMMLAVGQVLASRPATKNT
jgi:fucose permease